MQILFKGVTVTNIKPIKNENDYNTALRKVEKLFDAKLNTIKGEHLDILVTLIESYEEKYHKIILPEPKEKSCFSII